MADDPILELLRQVQPSWADRPGSEEIEYLKSRVVAAGGEPDAVAQWVEANGGEVKPGDTYERKGIQTGKTFRGEETYVVPRDALRG